MCRVSALHVGRNSLRFALAGASVLAAASALAGGAGADAAASGCPAAAPQGESPARIRAALASGRDVWGERLLRAPGGPTLARARRYLPPLLLARGPGQTALTDSGVYYLPFARPAGPLGAQTVALHVGDGSQIIAQRVGGRTLTVRVGPAGGERYGSCLARLGPARLDAGYLPVLRTDYRDAAGARYRQESFATRIPQTSSLVSFVRLEVDARSAKRDVTVVLAPSGSGLRRSGTTLGPGGAAQLAFSEGGVATGGGVRYRVAPGAQRTIRAAWLATPAPLAAIELDETTYATARDDLARYWDARLGEAMGISVPEQAVEDAVRAVLIQSLMLTWRYSIGNPYEQFSFPESPDTARVLAEYGLAPAARSILRTSLTRDEERYRNWKRGSRLVAVAAYTRLSGDPALLRQSTATFGRWVGDIERQLARGGRDLLDRERYSSDVAERVYGLHAQATAWEGLRAVADAWRRADEPALAARATAAAARLERGLRRAIAASQQRLPDGSLFLPMRLLDDERPYRIVVEQRFGSYWNLVAPYALASGLFAPGGAQADGALRYLELHGGRLLGIVRAGAYALYGRDAYPASGTNQVYDTSLVRALADNDEADRLVLTLYGSLAVGMTRDTFVAGEAASVAPLRGTPYRAMYLPPNSGANAAFLETARTLLVHETRDARGAPNGLRLAYATPRGWLRAGKHIAVTNAPTSFGPVSYALSATASTVSGEVVLPRRSAASVGLRLRLPNGTRIAGVTIDGARHDRFDPATGTIDLTGMQGSHVVVARIGAR
jgi:hypothetical protein